MLHQAIYSSKGRNWIEATMAGKLGELDRKQLSGVERYASMQRELHAAGRDERQSIATGLRELAALRGDHRYFGMFGLWATIFKYTQGHYRMAAYQTGHSRKRHTASGEEHKPYHQQSGPTVTMKKYSHQDAKVAHCSAMVPDHGCPFGNANKGRPYFCSLAA